jgi:hypothetical protein
MLACRFSLFAAVSLALQIRRLVALVPGCLARWPGSLASNGVRLLPSPGFSSGLSWHNFSSPLYRASGPVFFS